MGCVLPVDMVMVARPTPRVLDHAAQVTHVPKVQQRRLRSLVLWASLALMARHFAYRAGQDIMVMQRR